MRFSVWNESQEHAEAAAAVSLDEDEAARLAHFLRYPERHPVPAPRLRSIFRDLRATYFSEPM